MTTNHDALREAAQAVIDRWDTPLWKDVPATAVYIARLREAIAASKPAPQAQRVELCPDAACAAKRKCTRIEQVSCLSRIDIRKPEPQAQTEPKTLAQSDTSFGVIAAALYDFQEATGCSAADEAKEALAKKDAALKACVEALEAVSEDRHSLDMIMSAITQGQEARK